VVFGLALLGGLGRLGLVERRVVHRLPAPGGLARPLVMGIAFGAAWTPCVGPLLGSALIAAARSGGAGRGIVLLFAYGLGVGAPFVVSALAIVAVPAFVARLRAWTVGLHLAAGAALVVLGGLLLVGRYGWFTSLLAGVTKR
jgi:cytochrome c-type biogenesis protein